MPTVFSFGDSFSEDFELFAEEISKNTWRYDYIHNHLNGEVPKTFAHIVADKLGFNYVCRAAAYGLPGEGNCNQSMYNNFCLSSPEISENDIVFFGYTNSCRFKWYNPSSDMLTSVLPNNLIVNLSNDEVIAMEQTLLNREKRPWVEEYIKFETLINEFAKCKNFKPFFWSHDKYIYNNLENHVVKSPNWLLTDAIKKYDFCLQEYLEVNGGHSIHIETNKHNKDTHFGKTAHEVLANLFLNELAEKNLI